MGTRNTFSEEVAIGSLSPIPVWIGSALAKAAFIPATQLLRCRGGNSQVRSPLSLSLAQSFSALPSHDTGTPMSVNVGSQLS